MDDSDNIVTMLARQIGKRAAVKQERELMNMASTSANPDRKTNLSFDDLMEAVKEIKDHQHEYWERLFDKFGMDRDTNSLYLPMWIKDETPPVPDDFDVTFSEVLEDDQLLVGPNIKQAGYSCIDLPNKPLEDLKHTR